MRKQGSYALDDRAVVSVGDLRRGLHSEGSAEGGAFSSWIASLQPLGDLLRGLGRGISPSGCGVYHRKLPLPHRKLPLLELAGLINRKLVVKETTSKRVTRQQRTWAESRLNPSFRKTPFFSNLRKNLDKTVSVYYSKPQTNSMFLQPYLTILIFDIPPKLVNQNEKIERRAHGDIKTSYYYPVPFALFKCYGDPCSELPP